MKCPDSRKCFARREENGGCAILTKPYEHDGECPFCKPVANVTNGRKFEYKPSTEE